MCKFIYNLLINSKFAGLDWFNYIDLANKYDRVTFDTDTSIFTRTDRENEYILAAIDETNPDHNNPVFIKVTKEPDQYCVFYGNLMFVFHFDHEKNDKIVRIYVKRPEDEWTFYRLVNTESGAFDIMNPLNVSAEVYINYDINVLKLNRCYGENYKSGVWNKMFYRTLCSFINKTQGLTEINRIKKAYER